MCDLLDRLLDQGLALALDLDGRLRIVGPADVRARLMPEIREHRAELVQALRGPERPGKAPAATPATEPLPRRGKYGPAPVVRPPDPPPPPEPTVEEIRRANLEALAEEERWQSRAAEERVRGWWNRDWSPNC